jgi:phosphoenolpyruvate carboxykinase (ATP)
MDTAVDSRIRAQLAGLGLKWAHAISWNAPPAALYQEAAARGEGMVAEGGALAVSTGIHTGRSPGDKFVVRDATTEDSVWWDNNQAMGRNQFACLKRDFMAHARLKSLFVQDLVAGADPAYALPVRVVCEYAWQALFIRHLLIAPNSRDGFVPRLTVIDLPSFRADPARHGTRGETVIAIDLAQGLVLIGGTGYAGEMKKAVFTVLNFLLPEKGVLPMHGSANLGRGGDSAVFFGLSGTGKTTLSADPNRGLIGDDEHGWSDNGVFNFEGGCYAKVINLSPAAEPQIHATTHMFGTILENVVHDPVTRLIDLDADTITENTRASYPLEFIANAVPEKRAGHPKNIILLTCDASGVMPPIARLDPNQALYQFISGYTSKLAGTEAGLGHEPQMTFSTCFGGPFMVHHPYRYAELLKRKIERYGVNCWLVNTGWIGGPYGIGKRISIKYTRALLDAALGGTLLDVEYATDPVFGFRVPKTCGDVPPHVLNPAESWPDREHYAQKYRMLAARFIENFRKFEDGCPREVIDAGPRL